MVHGVENAAPLIARNHVMHRKLIGIGKQLLILAWIG